MFSMSFHGTFRLNTWKTKCTVFGAFALQIDSSNTSGLGMIDIHVFGVAHKKETNTYNCKKKCSLKELFIQLWVG